MKILPPLPLWDKFPDASLLAETQIESAYQPGQSEPVQSGFVFLYTIGCNY